MTLDQLRELSKAATPRPWPEPPTAIANADPEFVIRAVNHSDALLDVAEAALGVVRAQEAMVRARINLGGARKTSAWSEGKLPLVTDWIEASLVLRRALERLEAQP